MIRFVKYLAGLFSITPSLNVVYDFGRKDSQTVVLLHGIAATAKTWDGLIGELKDKNYRVIALDLVGFGDSPKPASIEYNVDDHVRYVKKTLKKLRVKKPYILVGHSMGGIIATRMSYLFPSDIHRLLLISLPLYIRQDDDKKTKKQIDFYKNAYDFLLKNKDFTIKNATFIRKLLRIEDGIDINEDNWIGFSRSLKNTVMKQEVYKEIVGSLRPIDIIYGSLDGLVIPTSYKKLQKLDYVNVIKVNMSHHLIDKQMVKAAIGRIDNG